MTISEFLNVINLASVDIFEINGKRIPLSLLNNVYAQTNIVQVDVITYIDKLTEEDILYTQIIDNMDDILNTINVEQQIPERSLLLKVKLNIIVKEDITI